MSLLASILESEEADRGEVLSLDTEDDTAEDDEAVQGVRVPEAVRVPEDGREGCEGGPQDAE